MFRYLFYILLAIVVVVLIAGGIHVHNVATKNAEEMAKYEGDYIPVPPGKLGKVLVVYYSFGGKTKDIAEKIQLRTDADMYEIKTEKELPSPPFLHFVVRKHLKSGEYPKLAGEMPDFSKYDMIFVGAPVWWYTIATPVLTFLDEADFKNKKVVPFSTQGSNVGSFFDDFKRRARNAQIQTSASFNNIPEKYDRAVDNKVSKWLNSL